MKVVAALPDARLIATIENTRRHEADMRLARTGVPKRSLMTPSERGNVPSMPTAASTRSEPVVHAAPSSTVAY